MKQLCLVIVSATVLTLAAQSLPKFGKGLRVGDPLVGRWDFTITTANGQIYPDWLLVYVTDTSLAATLQPRSGSTIGAGVKHVGNKVTLTVREAVWDLTLNGDKLNGTIKQGDTVQGTVAGVRAPELKRLMPAAWTSPEPIFNGKDLTGWEPMTPDNNHWVVKDGELVNEQHGANLKTTRTFDDFKLHIEFNCPDKGNSGIYLRGRYEVQIEYEPVDANDKLHSIGAVYSQLAPQAAVPRTPGTWESFDITLVGRFVTIVRNGTKTMDQMEIMGITGGAIDSNEAAPGPIYIQGDHTGGLRFRNITISVPRTAAAKKK